MALKEKLWLIALVAGILSFIGFVTPYISISQLGISMNIWSFGLVTMTPTPPFPIPLIDEMMIAGILIIISAILLIVAGVLAKKRENLKLPGAICIVGAILGLIGVFIPLGDLYISLILSVGGALSVGFYLPLFGSIIGIIAGAGAFLLK